MGVEIWHMTALKPPVLKYQFENLVFPPRLSQLEEGSCNTVRSQNLQKESNVNLYFKCVFTLPALLLLKASSAPMGPNDLGNN